MAKTITLDEREEAALRELLDAALRHNGIAALTVVIHFVRKLEQAAAPQQSQGAG